MKKKSKRFSPGLGAVIAGLGLFFGVCGVIFLLNSVCDEEGAPDRSTWRREAIEKCGSVERCVSFTNSTFNTLSEVETSTKGAEELYRRATSKQDRDSALGLIQAFNAQKRELLLIIPRIPQSIY